MCYDLIIVVKSIPLMIPVTQRCIDSALEDGADVNVILVETGNPYKYDNVNKIINYNGEFNYHRAMNIGLRYAKGDVFILANNDLVFRPGWSKIGELMRLNDYHSASCLSRGMPVPKGDTVYEGYHIGCILAGWCIFLDRYALDKIGKLDESVSFWFSDNLYADQLKAAGVVHGLFANCQVDHVGSATLKKMPRRTRRRLEIGEVNKYNERQKYYDKAM